MPDIRSFSMICVILVCRRCCGASGISSKRLKNQAQKAATAYGKKMCVVCQINILKHKPIGS